MVRKSGVRVVAALAVGLLLAQAVPYGRAHGNPPVVQEPAWPSPEVRSLAVRACFDCHSHQTRWPWYSFVAPVSWLVQHDVDEGRTMINLSAWNEDQPGADELQNVLHKATMPLAYYLLLHPSARLSAAERQQLLEALTGEKR